MIHSQVPSACLRATSTVALPGRTVAVIARSPLRTAGRIVPTSVCSPSLDPPWHLITFINSVARDTDTVGHLEGQADSPRAESRVLCLT